MLVFQVFAVFLQTAFQVAQRLEARPLELANPAVVDFLQRHRVEEVQLLAPTPLHRYQIRRFEHGKVLGHTLPGHVQVLTELAQRLAVVGVQTVHELPPPRVGQCLEQQICVAHSEEICKQTLACQGAMRTVPCFTSFA